MARNSGSYSKKRVKVKKTDLKKSPFDEEIYTRRNKRIILIVVGIIVLSMTATLIIPYFTNSQTANWKLPEKALKSEETVPEVNYNVKSITLGETFNRPDKEYYVIYGSNENTSVIETNLMRENYFVVDTSKFINSSALKDVDKGTKLPSNPNEIKIKKDLAIIKIKDGKAIEFINNKDDVIKYTKKIK